MHSTRSPRKLKSSAIFCLALCFAGAASAESWTDEQYSAVLFNQTGDTKLPGFPGGFKDQLAISYLVSSVTPSVN